MIARLYGCWGDPIARLRRKILERSRAGCLRRGVFGPR